MTRRHFQRLLILITGIVITALLPLQPTVFAQTPNAATGLEISPVLIDMPVTKGAHYPIEIRVHNVTAYQLYFDSTVNDFGAKDESGTPSIQLDPAAEPLPTSIQKWVSPITPFSLKANETTTVKTILTVPANAEPGGHYGVIRFAGHRSQAGEGSVDLIASAGTLVLLNVGGNEKQSLDLATFRAEKDGKEGDFFETGPLAFETRFTNTGTVHVKPVGHIEVKDGFGNLVSTVQVNSTSGNVLPASTRRFDSPLNTSWLFGKYTADLSIAYGTTGGAIVRTITFWVLPWKLIFVTLLVGATVIYILILLVKRYNKFIIERDRAKQKGKM